MIKMNRRDFLKGVAVLAASCAALSVLPKISNAKQVSRQLEKTNMLRHFMIGADAHGKNNEYLDLRFVIAEGKIEGATSLFIDGKEVLIDDKGNASKGEFSGLVHFSSPWHKELIDGHQYTGVDLRLKHDPVKFEKGIPRISFGVA